MIKSLALIAIIFHFTQTNVWSSRVNYQDNLKIQNKVISKASSSRRNYGALNHQELSNITKNAPVSIEDLMSIMNYGSPKKLTFADDYPVPPKAPRKNPKLSHHEHSPSQIEKKRPSLKLIEMIEQTTLAENEEKETQKLIEKYASMHLEDMDDIKD